MNGGGEERQTTVTSTIFSSCIREKDVMDGL